MASKSLSPGNRLHFGTENRLKLGLFGANMSTGIGMTTVPERWTADWSSNVEIAQLADAEGIDFLLPISRFRGYGGLVNPAGDVHETTAWACGLLAKTRRIHVFATVLAPVMNPVFAAKQFMTVDHVGEGRLGVNVVVGWNDDELEMLGIRLAAPERYGFGQEWVTLLRRIWESEAPFDFRGRYFDLKAVEGAPKPYGGTRPMIVNAGMSEEGRSFAIGECDALFSTPPKGNDDFGALIRAVKARAAVGRDLPYPVLTAATVVCRPTRKEATDFLEYCRENADWEAVDRMLDIRRRSGRPVPDGDLQTQRRQMLRGLGEFQVLGTPDDVADSFAGLAGSGAGADGIAMLFVNQLREVPFVIQEVLPRLRKRGLRA